VTGALVGPSSALVAGGGSATFSFSVRNTGNVPVTVHPVGSPAFWTFDFSFGNVTLLPGPSGTTLSGEVRVVVPAGTAVAHPGLTIQFETSNGTAVGSVTPAPTVNVVGYYGLEAGPSALEVQVSSSSANVPFYITNTGNQGETVVVAVADAARLSGLGWTSGIRTSQTTGTPLGSVRQYLSAGANQTLYVILNSTSSIFVPPGSVTLALSVLNATGSVSESTTLKVPIVSVSAGTGAGAPPFTVSGPTLGSPPNLPPDWLVPFLSFVPAIALVVGILTYRWWRTRRWTRR